MKETKAERYEQLHITVPTSDLEKWRAFKEKHFDGANVMSFLIRTAMNQYVQREENKRG